MIAVNEIGVTAPSCLCFTATPQMVALRCCLSGWLISYRSCFVKGLSIMELTQYSNDIFIVFNDRKIIFVSSLKSRKKSPYDKSWVCFVTGALLFKMSILVL